jgi:hypothetical protein
MPEKFLELLMFNLKWNRVAWRDVSAHEPTLMPEPYQDIPASTVDVFFYIVEAKDVGWFAIRRWSESSELRAQMY